MAANIATDGRANDKMPTHALAVERSDNRKLGDMSATYASQASCPASCPLLGAGCYAEGGPVGMVARKHLTPRVSHPLQPMPSAVDVAREEAVAIDGLSGRRPLRLHVVGDIGDMLAGVILNRAAADYTGAHGQPVYTYTHNWRALRPGHLASINLVASCDSRADVKQAFAAGYQTAAIVVPEHTSDKATVESGVRYIPCPAQTRGITCSDCRLCVTPKVRNACITFAAHGQRKRTVALTHAHNA